MNRFYLVVSFSFSCCVTSLSYAFSYGVQRKGVSELHELFFKAASEGLKDEMSNLLKKGADVDARNEAGWTALHYGVKGDNSDCINLLIEAKADLNVREDMGETPLLWAAHFGSLNCLVALINAKADLEICNLNGHTALLEAIQCGHRACVKALVDGGADVNSFGATHSSALHWAVSRRDSDCVNLLIEAKANVNVRDNLDNTPLISAAYCNEWNCIKALIKAKANVQDRNMSGNTALLEAVKERNSCVKVLVKYSYQLTPSEKVVLEARGRIFNALLQFVRLRKKHPELDNLKSETLQFEILTRNTLLAEDLVLILLDELKKGREIKGVALIRSKEAAVSYLLKRVKEIVSQVRVNMLYENWFPSARVFVRPEGVEENFESLIREGLDERCQELKERFRI